MENTLLSYFDGISLGILISILIKTVNIEDKFNTILSIFFTLVLFIIFIISIHRWA